MLGRFSLCNYCTLVVFRTLFSSFLFVSVFFMLLLLDWKMSLEYSAYIGFVDGTIPHTQNLSFTAWVIYLPLGQVVASGGAFLGPKTNNVAKYSAMIELLRHFFFEWYPIFGSSPGFLVGSVTIEW
jgi:hypothetical protein